MGRPCMRIDARTRASGVTAPYWPADRLEIDLDRAYLVILRISASLGGRDVAQAVLGETAFDVPIDQGRFKTD